MNKSDPGEEGLQTSWGERQVKGSTMCKGARDHSALGTESSSLCLKLLSVKGSFSNR